MITITPAEERDDHHHSIKNHNDNNKGDEEQIITNENNNDSNEQVTDHLINNNNNEVDNINEMEIDNNNIQLEQLDNQQEERIVDFEDSGSESEQDRDEEDEVDNNQSSIPFDLIGGEERQSIIDSNRLYPVAPYYRQLQYNQNLSRLASNLDRVDRTSSYCGTYLCHGEACCIEIPSFSIKKENEQDIIINCSPLTQINQLIQLNNNNNNNNNEQELNRSWKIDSNQLSMIEWQSFMSKVMACVCKRLGCNKDSISVTFEGIHIHSPGYSWDDQRDDQSNQDMMEFAKLFISIPSEHDGGSLQVDNPNFNSPTTTNNNNTSTFTLCSQVPTYVAFYSDCHHRLTPITSGYRVYMVYRLRTDNSRLIDNGSIIHMYRILPSATNMLQTVTNDIHSSFYTGINRMVYTLSDIYNTNVSILNLTKSDYLMTNFLIKACQPIDSIVTLATLIITWNNGYIYELKDLKVVSTNKNGEYEHKRFQDSYTGSHWDLIPTGLLGYIEQSAGAAVFKRTVVVIWSTKKYPLYSFTDPYTSGKILSRQIKQSPNFIPNHLQSFIDYWIGGGGVESPNDEVVVSRILFKAITDPSFTFDNSREQLTSFIIRLHHSHYDGHGDYKRIKQLLLKLIKGGFNEYVCETLKAWFKMSLKVVTNDRQKLMVEQKARVLSFLCRLIESKRYQGIQDRLYYMVPTLTHDLARAAVIKELQWTESHNSFLNAIECAQPLLTVVRTTPGLEDLVDTTVTEVADSIDQSLSTIVPTRYNTDQLLQLYQLQHVFVRKGSVERSIKKFVNIQHGVYSAPDRQTIADEVSWVYEYHSVHHFITLDDFTRYLQSVIKCNQGLNIYFTIIIPAIIMVGEGKPEGIIRIIEDTIKQISPLECVVLVRQLEEMVKNAEKEVDKKNYFMRFIATAINGCIEKMYRDAQCPRINNLPEIGSNDWSKLPNTCGHQAFGTFLRSVQVQSTFTAKTLEGLQIAINALECFDVESHKTTRTHKLTIIKSQYKLIELYKKRMAHRDNVVKQLMSHLHPKYIHFLNVYDPPTPITLPTVLPTPPTIKSSKSKKKVSPLSTLPPIPVSTVPPPIIHQNNNLNNNNINNNNNIINNNLNNNNNVTNPSPPQPAFYQFNPQVPGYFNMNSIPQSTPVLSSKQIPTHQLLNHITTNNNQTTTSPTNNPMISSTPYYGAQNNNNNNYYVSNNPVQFSLNNNNVRTFFQTASPPFPPSTPTNNNNNFLNVNNYIPIQNQQLQQPTTNNQQIQGYIDNQLYNLVLLERNGMIDRATLINHCTRIVGPQLAMQHIHACDTRINPYPPNSSINVNYILDQTARIEQMLTNQQQSPILPYTLVNNNNDQSFERQ